MKIHSTYIGEGSAGLWQPVFLVAMMLLMMGVTTFLLEPVVSLLPLTPSQGMMLLQLLSSLLLFLVPALLLDRYYRMRRMAPYFHPGAKSRPLDLLIGAGVMVAAFVPSLLLEEVMRAIPEPDLFRAISAELERTTEMLVFDRTPAGVTLALLALVVAAPIGEEYFFRGALQEWMLRLTHNGHAAVWVVALLFSLIHLEWTGFLARLLLGALLGYLALSGGLRVSVLAHAVNNLLAYLVMHFAGMGATDGLMSGFGGWVAGLLCLVVIYLLLRHMSHTSFQSTIYEDK